MARRGHRSLVATKHFIDTHAFLWHLAGSSQLGAVAKLILQDPESELFLPATALAEACWIVERGRVALKVSDVLTAVENDSRITVLPLDRTVIERSIGLTAIGEMHDRQIVATALVAQDQGDNVDLLTKDEQYHRFRSCDDCLVNHLAGNVWIV